MVVDTSIILAVFFNEERGYWAAKKMTEHAADLRMSTVSLTEVLIKLEDRQPQQFALLRKKLLDSNIRFVAPNLEQAELAAKYRLRYPLNLGDCFVVALAKKEGCPILTLDKDFTGVDAQVVMPE
jgi:uncharacterized protein with PIN domain